MEIDRKEESLEWERVVLGIGRNSKINVQTFLVRNDIYQVGTEDHFIVIWKPVEEWIKE